MEMFDHITFQSWNDERGYTGVTDVVTSIYTINLQHLKLIIKAKQTFP